MCCQNTPSSRNAFLRPFFRVPRFVIPHPDLILSVIWVLLKPSGPIKSPFACQCGWFAVRRAPPCMFVLGKMSVFKLFTEERASFLELWHIWDLWLFSWRFAEVKRSRSGRVSYVHEWRLYLDQLHMLSFLALFISFQDALVDHITTRQERHSCSRYNVMHFFHKFFIRFVHLWIKKGKSIIL